MAMTLDDLYAQMLGVMPPPEMPLTSGPVSPYATPLQSEAMGMGYPLPLMTEYPQAAPPESAQVDPMLGVTSAFGAGMTAPEQYGYSPQPRPALPAGVADPAVGLYGPFRGVWEQMQEEEDPLAALMAGPGQEESMAPRTPPLPWERTPQFIPQQPSRNERIMQSRYPRAMERVSRLRGVMAQRGF